MTYSALKKSLSTISKQKDGKQENQRASMAPQERFQYWGQINPQEPSTWSSSRRCEFRVDSGEHRFLPKLERRIVSGIYSRVSCGRALLFSTLETKNKKVFVISCSTFGPAERGRSLRQTYPNPSCKQKELALP